MSNVTVSIKMSPKQSGALYMKCAELEKRIAELDKELSEYKAGLGVCMTDEQFEINNLEQQAKGVYESVWFCKFEGVRTDEQPNRHISHLLNSRVKELREQAKGGTS
jgi:chromosome segregation ATPase